MRRAEDVIEEIIERAAIQDHITATAWVDDLIEALADVKNLRRRVDQLTATITQLDLFASPQETIHDHEDGHYQATDADAV